MTTLHTNKTYLVTGGTTGIGAATVRHLAEAGARVIATGRSPKTLEEARKAAPANVEVFASDAGNVAAVEGLVGHVKGAYGTLDGAFINAGIAPFAPLETWSEAQFDA
ncbi:MAG: SDR family NAD(P)-dependent oxidoreductase, partial [Myxococcota bacterium]